ncbi:MAG: DUF1223 domain-containing protein [Proteobacteria bacterium]|nr:DUF1223 domain-containing protein [Pseudomonadota bacterium]
MRQTLIQLVCAVALLMVGAPVSHAKEATLPRPILVELYTSQGCISCPPADKLLGEMSENPDLLVLSFHVDYWNKNGWEDPFSSSENTERQKHYSEDTGLFASIYTPQVIVDGVHKAIGSREKELAALIKNAAGEMIAVPLTIRKEKNWVVRAGEAPESLKDAHAEVLVVGFDKVHRTNIEDGENKGSTIDNFHVVRWMQVIGEWDGKPHQYNVMDQGKPATEFYAVILQEMGQKRIFGVGFDPSYPPTYSDTSAR